MIRAVYVILEIFARITVQECIYNSSVAMAVQIAECKAVCCECALDAQLPVKACLLQAQFTDFIRAVYCLCVQGIDHQSHTISDIRQFP